MEKLRCIKPIGGVVKISSPFGERIDPVTKLKKTHNGVDFACIEGTPIRAILDGKIIRSGWESDEDHKQGYGQRIWQECRINNETVLVVYAHLNEIHKHEGEYISQSGILGLSGNTGKSTGPHLHLGSRIKDTNHFLDFDFEENHANA